MFWALMHMLEQELSAYNRRTVILFMCRLEKICMFWMVCQFETDLSIYLYSSESKSEQF